MVVKGMTITKKIISVLDGLISSIVLLVLLILDDNDIDDP